MSFSTDVAALVSAQLSRFININRHQLAGQAANLDFWLGQVRHALNTIDGYGVRFVRMSAAQEQYVAVHGTKEFDLDNEYARKTKPSPPHRVPDRELRKARKELIEAATRFVNRCHDEGLISDSQHAAAFNTLGISQHHE